MNNNNNNMNNNNSVSLFGSMTTNCVNSMRTPIDGNNCSANTPNPSPFPSNHLLLDQLFHQNQSRVQPQPYPLLSPTYPPYNTSNWSSNGNSYYRPSYTFATQPLVTNTTNSQSIPNSSAVYMNSKISQTEDMKPTIGFTQGCNESKQEFKILIDFLNDMRKSNEQFQNNLLTELRQLKEVLIDLKSLTHEMPLKFSEALTNSLASVQSRSNSVSIDSETEIVDIMDNIDISKSLEDDANSHYSKRTDFTQTFDNYAKENSNSIKSSTIDKFIFPYDSTIDMNKWLKKV